MFTASFKLIQPCPFPANLVLPCYFCSLLSPCLVCMLRMLRCLGPEFRVLVLRLSVPNRVWDFMGSPLLTYLASNILVVAQADLPFENMHIYLVGSLLADIF